MERFPGRSDLKVGVWVEIETKEHQGMGRLIAGRVRNILTTSENHPHGIKVRLNDGQVGRVKKITDSLEAPTGSFADLDTIPIPKTEDKYNEFKEFYQYDRKMEHFKDSMNESERRKAIDGMKYSVRERFAKAVCAFGNDGSGGFVYLGVRSDGTVTGLEKDRELGDFADYNDAFANHIRDTLETLLKDRVFVISKIKIQFRQTSGKTICIVQVLPASTPLYLHAHKMQTFYVRGPTPRAEKLTDQREQFRYIKSRFPHYG